MDLTFLNPPVKAIYHLFHFKTSVYTTIWCLYYLNCLKMLRVWLGIVFLKSLTHPAIHKRTIVLIIQVY